MTIRGGTLWIDSTPTVLWAVSAVIAVIPCTPQRANAFRSAWIPAPPPESEPAIEIAVGIRRSPGTGPILGSGDRRRARRAQRGARVASRVIAGHVTEQFEAGQGGGPPPRRGPPRHR